MIWWILGYIVIGCINWYFYNSWSYNKFFNESKPDSYGSFCNLFFWPLICIFFLLFSFTYVNQFFYNLLIKPKNDKTLQDKK